jgi:hypothetical protein
MKTLSLAAGAVLFGLVVVVGLYIGAAIASYVFLGVLTLLGMVVVIESIKPLKWLVRKSNRVIDLVILGLTIYAGLSLGPTIAASLTVAGLGFTLVYVPWIRKKS